MNDNDPLYPLTLYIYDEQGFHDEGVTLVSDAQLNGPGTRMLILDALNRCVLATGAPATIRGRTGFDVTVKGHGGEGQATSLTAQTTNADSEEFALPLAA